MRTDEGLSTQVNISLESFIEACRGCVHPDEASAIDPDSWVWKDLSLWGEDWWDFAFNALTTLNCDFDPEHTWNVYNYIPNEGEVGLFGRYTGVRSLPDISLREVYAFIQDGLLVRHA